MDLTSGQNIQNLLKRRGLKPVERFGQNFLVDETAINQIIAAASLSPEDTVLEIGPGSGVITQKLAQKVQRVVAVEKDRQMVEILKETLKGLKNTEVINRDILKLEAAKLLRGNWKVVGNLPFYLTAPVIRKFLEMSEVRPQLMTLVVQKEVAQRICAKPPKMSILSNSVQFYAQAEIVSYISKKSFWPEPEVDAAIIKITPRPAPMGGTKMFFEVVKAGFSHPRKQLLNNLSQGLKKNREDVTAWLQKNNLSPQQRAETLSVEDWLHLTVNH